jgi:hypothetical protein
MYDASTEKMPYHAKEVLPVKFHFSCEALFSVTFKRSFSLLQLKIQKPATAALDVTQVDNIGSV